jgi:hypothetical protein
MRVEPWVMRNILLLAMLLAGMARAGDPILGTYNSTDGRTVVVSATSGSFKLIWINDKGEKNYFKAQWTRPGKEFLWWDAQNTRHVAKVSEKEKGVIIDVGDAYPDSKAYWRKP